MKPVGFVPGPVPHTFPWITITDVSYVLSPPFMSPLATVAAGKRGKMEAQAFAKRGSLLIGRARYSRGTPRLEGLGQELKESSLSCFFIWNSDHNPQGGPNGVTCLLLSGCRKVVCFWNYLVSLSNFLLGGKLIRMYHGIEPRPRAAPRGWKQRAALSCSL